MVSSVQVRTGLFAFIREVKMGSKDVPFSVALDKATRKQLDRLAKLTGRSRGDVVRRLIQIAAKHVKRLEENQQGEVQ
jgi:predicted transcriptional regulator